MILKPASENKTAFMLAGREIGPSQPPYIVAEMSGNHNGNLEHAMRIMEAAARAGADAVKLQTYTADTLTIDHDGPDFQINDGPWQGYNLYKLYEWAHTPWEWHEALFNKGRELGITVFSSPFDATAVDFLESLQCPAYKIASFEAVDIALIKKAAATGKPLIISTGLANKDEIQEAEASARSNGCHQLILMHCTSAYPAAVSDSDLRMIPELAEHFDVITGLSDHTPGIEVALGSVALGAAIIEKHVTLDRSEGGPDAAFSLEPQELADLCRGTRAVWEALGTVDYTRKPAEVASLVFRRSLYVVADMKEGDVFTEQNLRSIRPGHGLAPKYLPDILGTQATCDISRGTALDWSMVKRG